MASQVVTFVFFAVLALWCGAWMFLRARKLRLRFEVSRRIGTEETPAVLREPGEDDPSEFEQNLELSGLGWTPEGFFVRTGLAALFAGFVGALVGGAGLALVFASLGGAGALMYVRRARERQIRLIDEQMPRALELMAMSLRAGHSLAHAVKLSATEAPSPIGDHLKRVSTEHELGSPLGEVFRRFADRFADCEAVNTFVVAVSILERTGGNLVAVIDRIVETSRARAQYRARLNALTAQGRSSAKLLGFLPLMFGGFAAMMDPAYFRILIAESGGRTVLFIVLALWLVGMTWTRRIARPEW